METYNLSHDIKAFGVQVKTFPMGVGEAFHDLIQKLPNGDKRSYYGISVCTDKGIIYSAAAEEAYPGEADKYDYEKYEIQKGEYLTEEIKGWQQKINCIKDVFEELMKDKRVNSTLPPVCVEWYKNQEEMLCMIKIN